MIKRKEKEAIEKRVPTSDCKSEFAITDTARQDLRSGRALGPIELT